MTDGLVTENASSQNVSSPVVSTSATTSVDATAPVVEKPQEKLLKQSEVNEIVGSAKREAYEKGKRESLAEYQKSQALVQQPNYNANQTIGGMSQLSDEKIRQLINEEAQTMTNMAVAQKIANEFTQKMMAAKDKYPDFEQVVGELNLVDMPQIVNWANSLDNTADVMYELAKYPEKLSSVTVLAYTNPRKATVLLQKLSDSIKQNESALKQPSASEPLSQIKPSTTGTDNGSRTVSDLRKQPWLRG